VSVFVSVFATLVLFLKVFCWSFDCDFSPTTSFSAVPET
jgi:hypothetical protein